MSPDDCPEPIRRLIESARLGSAEALGDLLNAFRPYLLQVAFEELDSGLRVKESPSDVVQRSFMEATANFENFQGERPEVFQAWLRQILLNNLHDLRDRFHSDKRRLSREVGPIDEVASGAILDITPPSEAVLKRERALQMEIGLQQLSDDARELIVLRHQQDLSFAEIAKKLNITEDAARKRWARAIESLRHYTRNHH